jgi:hypothetical protein
VYERETNKRRYRGRVRERDGESEGVIYRERVSKIAI